MSVYVIGGTLSGSNYVTMKAGALPTKIVRIDFSASVSIRKFTGGGVITGGTAITPQSLREGAPSALASGKVDATAVSGTSNYVSGFTSGGSYTFPASEIFAAGSSSVLAVLGGVNTVITIYIDELEIQPGY